jgi:hypothetical protein
MMVTEHDGSTMFARIGIEHDADEWQAAMQALLPTFGSLVMWVPAPCSVTSWRPRGNGIGSVKGSFPAAASH